VRPNLSAEAKCSTCGKIHLRDELELSFRRPDAVVALPEAQRKSGVKESDDLCAIGSERFFVRAVLPLPVREWEHPYRIGIWVEVERAAFDRVLELWDDSAQHEEPPFRAKLANDIPSLQSTRGLPVRLQLTTPKTRAVVLVPECDHGLHREQSLGITAHRASEYSYLA
jgi:hypothetical protein